MQALEQLIQSYKKLFCNHHMLFHSLNIQICQKELEVIQCIMKIQLDYS